MLAVTGILINHSQQISFAEQRLPAGLAGLFYGLDESVVQSLDIGELLAQTREDELQISTQDFMESVPCTGEFIGARRFANEIWFACQEQISIYLMEDSAPHFAEILNNYSGLPTPIERFGACNLAPCTVANRQNFRYSADQSAWLEMAAGDAESFWSAAPENKMQYIVPAELNWERFLLDMHSGRLFGALGIFIVDATGVAIMLLVLSGFIRWMKTRKT